MQQMLKQCIVCTEPTNQCCSKCQKVFYCSRPHQEQHWSIHKHECEGRVRNNILTPTNILDNRTEQKIDSRIEKSVKSYKSVKEEQIQEKQFLKQIQQTSQQSIRIDENNLNEQVEQFVELYEQRKELRNRLIFDYVKGREDLVLDKCKDLLSLSKNMWVTFNVDITVKLLETYRIRTSKLNQNLEYLLDVAYAGKLYLKMGKRNNLKELLFNLQLPDLPTKIEVYNNLNQIQIDKYRLWKQQVESFKTCLSLLGSISNAGGFTSYTQNIYKQYAILVEQSYGINEQFLAYFMIGNWYVEIGEYRKALRCYDHCLTLKDSAEQISVSDCYYNLAFTHRMINQIELSIDKMHNALLIRREKIGKNSIEAAECLQFIGKQFIELQNYTQSIDYLNQCYNIRKSLLKQDDKRLIQISELIKNLFYHIKNKKKQQERRINVTEAEQLTNVMEKIENESELVRDEHYFKRIAEQNKNIKKLQKIEIDPSWFDSLQHKDLQSLSKIIENCQVLPIDQAIIYVLESTFYTNLSEEKKLRFKQLNPQFQ